MDMKDRLLIRPMTPADVPVIASAFIRMGWSDRTRTLQRYLREQAAGERAAFVAEADGIFAGYVTVKWVSDYPGFASRNIPEISDLNMVAAFRRRGIASRLLDASEAAISTRSPVAGLGVGLTGDYGPAQRLYVKRGYVPDGLGIAYKGETVKHEQQVTVDDDLLLFMTKRAPV